MNNVCLVWYREHQEDDQEAARQDRHRAQHHVALKHPQEHHYYSLCRWEIQTLS